MTVVPPTVGAIQEPFSSGDTNRSNRAARPSGFIAALALGVPMLIGHLLLGVPPASAEASRSHELVKTTLHAPYPPYPPANCLRHAELPVEQGWKVGLAWLGGRSCPRIFFRPARAEIWMYQGAAAPLSGPWTGGRAAEPAARYGGHDETAAKPKPNKPNPKPKPTVTTTPAATWWEKVATVPVDRDGSWSAEVFVEEEGPYTFAAVNSISREYVLVEVEIVDEPAQPDGAAGGSGTVRFNTAVGPDGGPGDPLRRVGVPAAASVLAMGLALGLVLVRRRTRAPRQRRVSRQLAA